VEGARGGEGSTCLEGIPRIRFALRPRGSGWELLARGSAWSDVCLRRALAWGLLAQQSRTREMEPAMLRVRVRGDGEVLGHAESRYQQTATEGPVLLPLPCFRSLPSALRAAATQGTAGFQSAPLRGACMEAALADAGRPVSCSPAVPWASHSVKQTSQRPNLGCGRCSPPICVILPFLPRAKRRGGEVQARLAVMPIIEQHRAPLLCPSPTNNCGPRLHPA
jgi:hypothetical protein